MTSISPYSYIRNCWYVVGPSAEFQKEKLTWHVIRERPVVMWLTRHGDRVAYDRRRAHKRFPPKVFLPDIAIRPAPKIFIEERTSLSQLAAE